MQDVEELTRIREAAEQSPEYAAKLAAAMNEEAFGLYLSGSLRNSGMQGFGHKTCKLYFDSLVENIFPGVRLQELDPILRMRIEQVVMMHHNICILYTEGTSKQHLEARKVTLSLAVQLLAEFRRLSTLVRVELAELNTCVPQDSVDKELKIQGGKEISQSTHAPKKEVA